MKYYKITWVFLFVFVICSFSGCGGCHKKATEDSRTEHVSAQDVSANSDEKEKQTPPVSESSVAPIPKVETDAVSDVLPSLSDRKNKATVGPAEDHSVDNVAENTIQTPVSIKKADLMEKSEGSEAEPKPLELNQANQKPAPNRLELLQAEAAEAKNEQSQSSSVQKSTVSQPSVNTKSPVNTESPVRTESPVSTESPVKENQPIRKVPTQGISLGLMPKTIFAFGVALSSAFLADEPAPKPPQTGDGPKSAEQPPTEQKSESQQKTEPASKSEPETKSTDIPPAEKTEPAPNLPPQPSAQTPPETSSERPMPEGRPHSDGPRPEGRPDQRPDYRQGSPRDRSPKDSGRALPEQTGETKQAGQVDQINKTEQRKLRFNFRYAPWKDVIEWFADQADLSLQADNVPTGSLNLTDNNLYTPTEALDILNSYLLFKEYTIIRKGKSMFVIYLPDGIPPNLLEPISPSQLDERGKYELCRCVFNLTRTTPDVIQLEAEKLLGPQGSIVVLPKSQQIVVTETGGTLRTIRDIIKKVDDPDDLAGGSIHIVEMKNLSADEALGIMRKLLAIEETDQSLRTAVDISGTKIWMSGRGDMIERAKEIIKTIDNSYESKDVALEGQPQFEVYDVGTADPNTVLSVLQTLLAGTSDVRLSIDTKTGGIAALGRPANHATIRETIRQMQLSVPSVEVIPLKRLSPASAVDSIKKFFATSSISSTTSTSSTNKQETGVPAPTVEADVSARQIIVRGTRSQIADIRSLLEKLGEDGTGGIVRSQETIRTIPLSASATALVLDQLKEIWPKLEQNEIKVVTPSAIVPMRSTNDLMPKANSTPKQEQPQKSKLDELIDKTFQVEPSPKPKVPTTFRRSFSNVRFLPVQSTVMKEVGAENDHQPVYQPIHAVDSTVSSASSNETEELKRQLAELQKRLDALQSATSKNSGASSTELNTITKKTVEQPLSETKKSSPVVVSSGPNGLMISSEDPEALDKLEELIRMLSDETVLGKTSLVVYYLKNSTAEVVSQTLQTLMGSSSSTTFGVSGSGSIDTSPNFEGEQRAALLGMLQIGNSIEKTGPLSISADSRLNALLVQANPVDHKTIERLLPILDQEEIPGGEIKRKARPRLIPLQNMRAEDAQTSVETIFSNQLQGGSSGQQGGNRGNTSQRQQGRQGNMSMMMPGMPPGMPGMMPGGPGAMIQQMMSRMGGGQGSSTTSKEQEATMTLGVDSRSNSLIVSAPESLFLEVEAFVKELDYYAAQTETVVEVVRLKEISSDLAKQTISNLAGDSVKFSTSQSTSQSSGGTNRSGFGGSGFGGFGSTSRGGFGGSNTGNPFSNTMRQGGFGNFGGQRTGGFGGFGGFGGQPGAGGFGGQRTGGFGGR